MNNYPRWWNTTVTVFNKFTDSQTQVVTWYKTVIEGCFWKSTGNRVIVGNTVLDTKNIICRIRKDDRFKEKLDWEALTNDTMQNYFTLSPGDIIVKGSVSDTIDEYTAGKRSSDLLKKYRSANYCMEIQSASDNSGEGFGNQHYYVVGI